MYALETMRTTLRARHPGPGIRRTVGAPGSTVRRVTQSWFPDARFGLFVHWGVYSAQGWEPSWPLTGGVPIFPHCQSLDVETYYSRVGDFAPPEGAARDWARRARECGMTYAVLTTKHHDGYALFDCDAAPFGVRTYLPGRDLVREFVDAVRAEGLRVGLYFSVSDWHHPDYPPFATRSSRTGRRSRAASLRRGTASSPTCRHSSRT